MVDLSQFVDKDVVITLRYGSKRTGTVERTTSSDHPYSVANISYTQKGGFYSEGQSGADIIHIELLNPKKKYEQLEQQIKELQNEVDRLKKEEKEEEKKNKLPKGFNRKMALLCIKTQYRHDLDFFDWSSTPQGYDYWADIYHNRTPFTNAAIMQLQEWVIISYQQEYEKE